MGRESAILGELLDLAGLAPVKVRARAGWVEASYVT